MSSSFQVLFPVLVLVLVLGGQVLVLVGQVQEVLVLVLGGQVLVLVLVLGGQVLVLVLGGQVLVNIPVGKGHNIILFVNKLQPTACSGPCSLRRLSHVWLHVRRLRGKLGDGLSKV